MRLIAVLEDAVEPLIAAGLCVYFVGWIVGVFGSLAAGKNASEADVGLLRFDFV